MTASIQGTELYGKQRRLADELRAHRQHLANAPLGKKAENELKKVIERLKAELKLVREQIRKAKS